MLNGISVSGLSEYVGEIRCSPQEGRARYGVRLAWESGTRSVARTLPMKLGAHRIQRAFSWTIDEPRQLLGLNHGPTPQEYLLSAVGACILVGFAVGASVLGIRLEKLEVELEAELDLAGFLGIAGDQAVPLEGIRHRITAAGDGTREQFEELHRQAVRHSPNAMSIARGVPLSGELVVESCADGGAPSDRRPCPGPDRR